MLLILITGILLILCTIITIVSYIMSDKVIYNAQQSIRHKINAINKLESFSSQIWKRFDELTDEEKIKLKKLTKKENLLDILDDIFDKTIYAAVGIVIFGLAFLIMALILIPCCSKYGINYTNIEKRNQYNKIISELENDNLRDEFNIRTKDIVDEVNEWNTKYQQYELASKNIWFGCYNPMEVYDGTGIINIEEWSILND